MSGSDNVESKDYSAILLVLLNALRHLVAQKNSNQHDVLILWSAVRTTARLCELDQKLREELDDLNCRLKKPYGITDAIRSILFLSAKPLRPTEIRDALISIHFDMRKYSFPMANVHSSVKRLA